MENPRPFVIGDNIYCFDDNIFTGVKTITRLTPKGNGVAKSGDIFYPSTNGKTIDIRGSSEWSHKSYYLESPEVLARVKAKRRTQGLAKWIRENKDRFTYGEIEEIKKLVTKLRKDKTK